jgi:hypothetical protein
LDPRALQFRAEKKETRDQALKKRHDQLLHCDRKDNGSNTNDDEDRAWDKEGSASQTVMWI